MKAYFISGLGADSRVFSYLKIPKSIDPVFIDWLIPDKNETLKSYASRMAASINSSEPFILIGLSFGGIIAVEMLEFLHPQKTILISSVACRQELPFYYRLAGYLKLAFLLPANFASRPNFLTYWALGIRSTKEKELVQENFVTKHPGFPKWAITEILNWKQLYAPTNIIRIHGNKDRILPITNFTPPYIIKDGSHFMIVNKAGEISSILTVELSNIISI